MDDLVKRLRDVNHGWPPDVCLEAADRIEAQAAEIARLREVLQDVHGVCADHADYPSHIDVRGWVEVQTRNAHAAPEKEPLR